MFKFLRRVFIILILLIIIFFIFRLIKPEATSRFVDKVKTIPTTISSRFHREKKSELIINGSTTSTSSNFEIEDNTDDNEIFIPVSANENDLNTEDSSRLDELNRELDKIIDSGNSQMEWNGTNSEEKWDLKGIISELINDNNEAIWNNKDNEFAIIDVEQPYESEPKEQTVTQNTNQTTTNNNSNNNSQTTNNSQNNKPNNTTSTRQQWDCWEWLSVQDCEEMYNIFWNINLD